MDEKIKFKVGEIQRTLVLPLWGRAVESMKENPRLVDEMAVNIIEQLDIDLSPAAANLDDLTQIAWIMRSLIGDQVIRDFLLQFPEGTIVNVGCGLDTTFDRVDNGKLRWYDLDLPDVIALRKKFIPEEERRTCIAASFLDQEWLNTIPSQKNILFMAAGVFYYFNPEKIQIFFTTLLDRFPGCEILFDVASEAGVRIANQKVIESSGLDERSHLVWGLKNVKQILDWDPRIKLIKKYSYYRKQRLNLRNFLMGRLADLLGIQYMLHLRFGDH